MLAQVLWAADCFYFVRPTIDSRFGTMAKYFREILLAGGFVRVGCRSRKAGRMNIRTKGKSPITLTIKLVAVAGVVLLTAALGQAQCMNQGCVLGGEASACLVCAGYASGRYCSPGSPPECPEACQTGYCYGGAGGGGGTGGSGGWDPGWGGGPCGFFSEFECEDGGWTQKRRAPWLDPGSSARVLDVLARFGTKSCFDVFPKKRILIL